VPDALPVVSRIVDGRILGGAMENCQSFEQQIQILFRNSHDLSVPVEHFANEHSESDMECMPDTKGNAPEAARSIIAMRVLVYDTIVTSLIAITGENSTSPPAERTVEASVIQAATGTRSYEHDVFFEICPTLINKVRYIW
jgi:hypothetical protein